MFVPVLLAIQFFCFWEVSHASCACGTLDGTARIVGGHPAKFGSHPWFAALIRSEDLSDPFCGGTLINNRYILTAAHCLYEKPADYFEIALNYYNLDTFKLNLLYEADQVIVHPNYNHTTRIPDWDIGLLRLTEPLNISEQIKPACLPSLEDKEFNEDLLAVGWGRLGRFDEHPEELHEVKLPEDLPGCDFIYGKEYKERHICTRDQKSKDWKDICNGDSGGPLLYQKNGIQTIVGLASHGNCLGTPPTVFTRITSYLDWIKEHTQDAVNCEN